MYIAHVLIFPVADRRRCSRAHLAARRAAAPHAVQRRAARRPSGGSSACRLFPGQAPRSLGLMLGVAGVLFLLGGLVQINPIWLWGPYHTYLVDERRAARLVPRLADRRAAADARLRPHDRRLHARPEPVLGRRRSSRSSCSASSTSGRGSSGASPATARFHNLLDRPRDAPWRTAIGVGVVTWVVLVFLAGAADRVFVTFGICYSAQIWFFRVLSIVLPARRRAARPPRLRRAPGRGASRGGAQARDRGCAPGVPGV